MWLPATALSQRPGLTYVTLCAFCVEVLHPFSVSSCFCSVHRQAHRWRRKCKAFLDKEKEGPRMRMCSATFVSVLATFGENVCIQGCTWTNSFVLFLWQCLVSAQ